MEFTRKLFERDDFPLIDLDSKYANGGRYYKTPNGKWYPSVTTVLSSQKDSSLDEWRAKVGEQEANRISRQATQRGTYLHSMCEDYLNNVDNYKRGRMPTTLSLFNSIKPVIDENVEMVYGIEMALFSHRLKTAGRTDVFCRFQGLNTILDFKTATREKKQEWIENYFVQATTYAIMAEEMYKDYKTITIPQIAIVIAVEDGEVPYQLFVKRTNDFRDQVYETFDLYHEQHDLLTLE